ncbi:hypothetical protein D046_5793B, partial [Vibrio parahaemolyticus V-223/04]
NINWIAYRTCPMCLGASCKNCLIPIAV